MYKGPTMAGLGTENKPINHHVGVKEEIFCNMNNSNLTPKNVLSYRYMAESNEIAMEADDGNIKGKHKPFELKMKQELLEIEVKHEIFENEPDYIFCDNVDNAERRSELNGVPKHSIQTEGLIDETQVDTVNEAALKRESPYCDMPVGDALLEDMEMTLNDTPIIYVKEEVDPEISQLNDDDGSNSSGISLNYLSKKPRRKAVVTTDSKCEICGKSMKDSDTVTIGSKGLNTLCKFSSLRNDNLFSFDRNVQSLILHKKCRNMYTKENAKGIYRPLQLLNNTNDATECNAMQPLNNTDDTTECNATQPLNNTDDTTECKSDGDFPFRDKCFICAEDLSDEIMAKSNRSKRSQSFKISNVSTKGSLLNALQEPVSSRNDMILRRIYDVDLIAAEARYHRKCYLSVLNKTKNLKRGRPETADVSSAIEIICNHIENSDDSQFNIKELRGLLTDYVPDDRTIIRKLSEKYGKRVTITEVSRGSTILILKDSADQILEDIWYNQKCNDRSTERLRIVRKAAEIIREDIRLKTYESDSYPSPNNFLRNAEQDVPDSLNIFLKTLAGKKSDTEELHRKLISIAHAIISVLRPRKFISCILLALAVTLKKNCESKSLLNLVNKLGFCTSYAEAKVFEESAVNLNHNYKDLGGFRQFVFDNAEANISTIIDGKIKFQAMSGIECTTSEQVSMFESYFPRTEKSADMIGHFGNVPLLHYYRQKNGLRNIIVGDFRTENRILPTISDILWLFGNLNDLPVMSGWNSFMQTLSENQPFEVTSLKALPIVNESSSSIDTINTALIMAVQKTLQSGQTITIVTFNQPLYAKARDIVAEAIERHDPLLSTVVVRLGGFHLLMSYMGAIGYIMTGSGLKELWSTIYSPYSVIHMLGGRAYSKALRAHLLTYLALAGSVMNEIVMTDAEHQELKNTLLTIKDGLTKNDLEKELFNTITNKFDAALCKFENKSPTSKLWIQYFKMVSIIKQFIEAERSGNWQLHLSAVKQMLLIFIASGYCGYAKSLRIYIQDMEKLEQVMTPDEYQKFTSGAFTIRRNDKFWSGTWTDMVLEESLIRPMESIGRFACGGEVTDDVLAKLVLSMPIVQKVETCLDSFCDLDNNIETTYNDLPTARIQRDYQDVKKLKEWLKEYSPFTTTEAENSIVSLSTGLVGDTKEINCHEAFEMGQKIISKKSGITYSDLKFSRTERVVTLSAVNALIKSSDHIEVSIDPLNTFQRITILKTSDQEMKNYLAHELTPFPLALFDEHGMRKTRKSVLYNLYKPVYQFLTEKQIYVIDGEHLLHSLEWNKGETFEDIAINTTEYVKHHYGIDTTIVFDGHEEKTQANCTKTAEKTRRSGYKNTAEVSVAPDVHMTTTQEEFLRSNKNKLRFIDLLQDHFEREKIEVHRCDADTDAYIVKIALQKSSLNMSVVMIGNDIDLLILLSAIAQKEHEHVYVQRSEDATLYNVNSLTYQNLKDQILTLHAFGGCDTTSAILNIGKEKCFQTVKLSHKLRQVLKVFTKKNVSQNVISRAGEQLFLALYGGNIHESLNELRYQKYAESITKSKITLANLPPTNAAAQQHALRVYHQVQTWLGNRLDPKEYGWVEQNRMLKPVMATIAAAPENVLYMIYCRCNTNCGAQCGCRKSALNCADSCQNCRGQYCSNFTSIDEADEISMQETDASYNIGHYNTPGKKRKI